MFLREGGWYPNAQYVRHFSRLSPERRETWWFTHCDPIWRIPFQTSIRESIIIRNSPSLWDFQWLLGQELIEVQWLTSGEWRFPIDKSPKFAICQKADKKIKKVSNSKAWWVQKNWQSYIFGENFALSYLKSTQKKNKKRSFHFFRMLKFCWKWTKSRVKTSCAKYMNLKIFFLD